jgi:acetyltransferase-like isoleucine patch superfamily enzyme
MSRGSISQKRIGRSGCPMLFVWCFRGLRKLKRFWRELERRAWEADIKRCLKRCGRGVRLNGFSVITGLDQIEIGDDVHIGKNAFIRGEGGLVIGDNTHISRNLVLYTVNHNYEGECLPYDHTLVKKPVRIGRNVWIGVKIVPGTTIEDGAIVGMGLVITEGVPLL